MAPPCQNSNKHAGLDPCLAVLEGHTVRYNMFRRICKQAGVRRYSFHTIRHFFASYLDDKKKRPISEISKLLRHSNVQTTERYLQLVDPHLRETMRLLEGDVVAWFSGDIPQDRIAK